MDLALRKAHATTNQILTGVGLTLVLAVGSQVPTGPACGAPGVLARLYCC